mmetsp:Transcript_16265/g.18420  ORF Transcript_16265/g.18420 Transcript_16265/m.18420 type:complete len:129 (-) Transcript_16265:137-523(-)
MASTWANVARRGALVTSRRTFAVRGAASGPAPPTFQRLPTPTQKLHEEHELLWDDSVAPEICLDFDLPNYSFSKGLAMFAGGFAFFGSMGLFLNYVWDPAGQKRTVTRTLPYDGLATELGGYDYSKTN